MALTLTFQGHPSSNLTVRLDASYIISYQCLILTTCLSLKIWVLDTLDNVPLFSYQWNKILVPFYQDHVSSLLLPLLLFLKIKSLHLWVRGKVPTKNQVDYLNVKYFEVTCLQIDTQTHTVASQKTCRV